MRFNLGIFALGLASILGSQSAFADQLVTNGGFETGDFTGWTLTGPITTSSNPASFYGVDTLDAYSGTYGAYLSTEPGQTALVVSQTLAVAPSHTYTLSFDLANLGGALTGFPNFFAVMLNGTTLFTESNAAASAYTPYSFTFTTTSTAPASEVLAIDAINTAAYFSLDNVSISTAATTTPEPATLLLVIPAIGLLALRRRKSA